MSKQRIFITGGASGLGEALALRFAQESWSVCIGDINEERGDAVVKELKTMGVRAHFVLCDVTRESDIQRAADWMQVNWGGADAVANNAGVAVAGVFENTSLEDWSWILDINVMGVVRGSKIFGKIFQAQGYGRIINIASAAGIVHPPRMAAYNASKAAVIAISETLRFEYPLIKVSVVCPTFFKTRLAETLRTSDQKVTEEMAVLVTGSTVSARVIADAVYQGVRKNRFMILPDSEARQARWAEKLLPEFLYFRAIEMAMRRKEKKLALNLLSTSL